MKKFIITTLFFGLIANNVLGQEAQTSVSFYTGTMSVNIPIYTIQDPDFTLPISLTYTANAFMPEQEISVAGMNWELNAGGRITRKIYGLPDDYKLNEAKNPKNGRINKLIKGQTFSDKESAYTNHLHFSFESGGFDYAPDMFYFNVNGINGWFYIDFQGEIRVVCNEPVTVDLENFSGNVKNTKDVPIIKLIDANGYTYIYGGNDTTFYSKILNVKLTDNDYYQDLISYIDSWYLSKIIAPNKREVNFVYATVSKSMLGVVLKEENIGQKECFRVDNLTDLLQNQVYAPSKSKYILPVLNKIKITDIDFEMSFNYDTKFDTVNILSYIYCPKNDTLRIYNADGTIASEEPRDWNCGCNWDGKGFSFNLDGKLIGKGKNKINKGTEVWCDAWEPIISKESSLKSISVSQGNNTRTCKFTYVTKMCNRMGSPNQVSEIIKFPYKLKRYLTKIETFENTVYNFEYNFDFVSENKRKKNFQPMSQLLDVYGYSVFNPQFGMLKSVVTPLGGKTVFTYEPHRYSQIKMYVQGNDYQYNIELLPATTQNLYKNLRIKKIENFDEKNNLVLSKRYYYDSNLYNYLRDMNENMFALNDNLEYARLSKMYEDTDSTDNNTTSDTVPPIQNASYSFQNISSGILHCDFARPLSNGKFDVFDRKKLQSSEPIPVTYPEVTEEITLLSGKKQSNIYKFFDYDAMPDFVEANGGYSGDISYFASSFASLSQRRGMLREQQIFEGNTKMRTINFSYTPLIDTNTPENKNYIVSNLTTTERLVKNILQKMYYAHTKPISVTTTDFINSSEITTSTKFIYDSKNRLSEKITNEIDGRKYFTKYKYADDIVSVFQSSLSGFAGGFQQIQKQGWLGRHVEVVSGYYENGNTFYTGGTISLFKRLSNDVPPTMYNYPPVYYLTNPSPYTPTYENYAALSQERSLVLPAPSQSYTFMSLNNGNIVYDERYKVFVDYQYNNKLRLTKVKPDNALETTYTWDSNNFYPTSETTGKFTTTYTYKPMVGKETETDSRGVKTKYYYDEFGRLIKVSRVINNVEETLQEYQYNYQK